MKLIVSGFLSWSFIFFCPLLSFGSWVSAGNGELFGDAHNPWFLRNVDQVKYCVEVAKTSVSASADEVRGLVKESLDYWKNELTSSNEGMGAGNSQFTLGSQTFSEIDCSEGAIDLRFQFGYETLTPEQISFLGDPTKYIGVSVRTNEDYRLNLHGKGFVFIASDIGEKAYHGGKDPTLVAQAWKSKKLLKYAILHELGHVFGVPHTGSGMMAETFLEQMLSVSLAYAFEKTPVESFFKVDEEIDFCETGSVSTFGLKWLGVPTQHSCLHLSYVRETGRWEVSSRQSGDPGSVLKLGTFVPGIPELSDYRIRPAIILQLMDNKTVFTTKETKFRSFMFGPMFIESGGKANFVGAPGNSKPAYMKISPGSLLIQVVNGLKIENIVSYSSPIGLLLLRDPTPAPNPKNYKKDVPNAK